MQVNRFNMPLLNVTGVNALHSNFNVAFGLAGGEKEEDFAWHLQCLQALREEHEIPEPSVILSDFCQAFKSAADKAFKNTRQQLCLWHIMKNVNHHLQSKWVESGVVNSVTLLPWPEQRDSGPDPEPPNYGDEGPDGDGLNDLQLSQQAEDSAAADRLVRPGVFAEAEEAEASQAGSAAPDRPGQQQPPHGWGPNDRIFTDDRNGFRLAFERLVYAPTKAGFNWVWERIKLEFERQIRESSPKNPIAIASLTSRS